MREKRKIPISIGQVLQIDAPNRRTTNMVARRLNTIYGHTHTPAYHVGGGTVCLRLVILLVVRLEPGLPFWPSYSKHPDVTI
jgi:hypothetical protein